MLSSNLTLDAHYNQIIAKAYNILGLVRRTFSLQNHTRSKKQLYVSLVRSQLLYRWTLWKPHFIKHIQQFEQVQRRATKYILNDFTSDYKIPINPNATVTAHLYTRSKWCNVFLSKAFITTTIASTSMTIPYSLKFSRTKFFVVCQICLEK